MKKILTISLCFGGVLFAACRKDVLIDVPTGFHGRVTISCSLQTANTNIIGIDAEGNGSAASCPVDKDMRVIQGGRRISAANEQRIQTGDGITTAIQFDVP